MLVDMSRIRTRQSGFTLIEMIVSLGVFSVVVTIAVGALLILIASNRQLQDEQAILSNLSFALDSMSRELRTGSNYFCQSHPNANGSGRLFRDATDLNDSSSNGLDPDDVNDCHNGRPAGHNYQGVAFIEGGESITGVAEGRILYFFRETDDPDTQSLYRKVGDNAAEKIVSDGIYITDAEFFVTGSSPLVATGVTDEHQASVTIYIEAAASPAANAKKHFMQTTVTQRTLDI